MLVGVSAHELSFFDSPVKFILSGLQRLRFPGSSRRACVRVCVCGGEAAAAAALRAHADLAARRPHDAPNMRFYIVPIGPCTVSRYLAASDSTYAALFASDSWPGICDRAADHSMPDIAEMSSRIARYLNSGGAVNNVPIGEAMVACRDRAAEDDCSQTFVPFIAEVRVGCGEGGPSSLELEEGGSPPARPSPPATPAPDVAPAQPPLLPHLSHTPNLPPQELQLDYWLELRSIRVSQHTSQVFFFTLSSTYFLFNNASSSIRNAFLYIIVIKITNYFVYLIIFIVMRLGKKKEKSEPEVGRAQTVEGVARLICSAKGSHNAPLKVFIDGTEWNGVKFFQLSTQWQTHVKTFPVATCGAPLAPPET
ncbi:Phosphofurin acidic cluster sorting protein 1 [Papilio machaon]|uniref:Phosphofurin acidic cluster sorting protein 1 n=1 Tax=Papilio machaon TaxID=76193 RepID=A0A0N1PH87_PAPMA|nr:Phosphofurin acidic cluster sorting protein 1 [Papilio machaon]